ncbi:lipoprotein insertase outer membrane protein LolB [Marinicella sp. W31]|uniref:lipoprotein insertase outer membrane protein LolB n=1 Tax=Marinicella sp. W31 TaxID=3023713 RepID=UPI0037579062
MKKQILWTCMLVSVLSACTRHQVRHTTDVNYQNLADVSDWKIEGKIAFSDGRDGGSGKFNWQAEDDAVQVELRAPLGQGSWRLNEEANGEARLYSGKDDFVTAEDAEILVSRQIGWHVPWHALKAWLRVTPHQQAQATEKQEDNILVISEQGWRIEYKKWSNASGRLLPTRITARKEPYSIKLSIRKWGF